MHPKYLQDFICPPRELTIHPRVRGSSVKDRRRARSARVVNLAKRMTTKILDLVYDYALAPNLKVADDLTAHLASGHWPRRAARETLESVSSCTRFSGFLTISSFGFNRLSSKLVSMFFGIVPMLLFVPKDFVSDRFVAQICANYGAHAHFGANLRDEAILNKIL